VGGLGRPVFTPRGGFIFLFSVGRGRGREGKCVSESEHPRRRGGAGGWEARTRRPRPPPSGSRTLGFCAVGDAMLNVRTSFASLRGREGGFATAPPSSPPARSRPQCVTQREGRDRGWGEVIVFRVRSPCPLACTSQKDLPIGDRGSMSRV